MSELERWNRKINLTGTRGSREIVLAHFLDSLSGLTALAPLAEAGWTPMRVVDIGAGAGFPGLPLKLYHPSWTVTLIEATKKKAAFLHHIVAFLGLTGIEVVAERSEQAAQDARHAGTYDLAVARAIAAPDVVSDLARPLLRAAGRLLLYLGPTGMEKAATWPPPGYRVTTSKHLILPFTKAKRTLLLLVRT